MRAERKGEMFIIHKRAIRGLDNFTYGEHRQYLVDRDDGAIQPCRCSGIPATMMLFGLLALMLPITALGLLWGGLPYDGIAWTNVYVALFIGFMLIGVGAGLSFGEYRLMKAVGPRCYDGKRVFYFEHPVFGDKEKKA